MSECSTSTCKRPAVIDDYCLGCFYVLVYEPLKLNYQRMKEHFTRVLAQTPKQLFDDMVQESRGIKEREI